MWMLVLFNVVPEVSRLPTFLFNLFSIFCSTAVLPSILSSSSFICSSSSFILLLIPSSVFFISGIVFPVLFVVQVFQVFIKHFMCLFALCLHAFSDLGSSLLSFLWILFLSPLHLAVFPVFYLIPSSGTYLSVVSFYLTFCFLFHRLQDCNSCFFWCLPLGGCGWSKGLV